MIDRENDTIVNGFGKILIGYDGHDITVSEVNPEQEIGERPEEGYEVLDKVKLSVDPSKALGLIGKLEAIKENPENYAIKTVLIDGWMVSFYEYNPKSIDVWVKILRIISEPFVRSLAC